MDDQDQQSQQAGSSQNESPTLPNYATEKGDEIDYSEIVADRYRIVSLLGHGGMGAVYKVEQIFLKQTFALKTLTAKNFTEIAIKRFQKEAQAAGKLTHPNLVRALDFGVLKNGNPFYVMDLVEGDNLAEYSRKIGSLKPEEVFKIFIPICFALGYAHTEGIIHRDIKPGNIMLARTGNPVDPFVPKIVDFGIAKLTDSEDGASVNLTQTGEVFGTPLYMSPEQCYGKNLDNRSDIYSLGCVLYEALTGAPPFTGESALALMMKHQSEEPASLKEASFGREFPGNLEKIVLRTLEKDPYLRYQRLEDLASDLANLQQDSNANIEIGPKANLKEAIRRSEKQFSNKKSLSLIQALGVAVVFLLIGFAVKPPTVEEVRVPIKMTISEEESEKRFQNLLTLGNVAYVQEIPNRHIKIYRFPRQFSACRFICIEDGNYARKSAFGTFQVGEKTKTGLEIPQEILISYPYLLRGFRPNDLQKLELGKTGDISIIAENSDGVYDVALAYASRLTGLIWITATETELTDVGIRCIQDLPSLVSVEVSHTPVTAGAIANLKNFDKLLLLGISEVSGGKTLLSRIATNKSLQALALEKSNLENEDVQKLRGATSLNFLSIQENGKLTDGALKGFTSLVQVRFGGTSISPKIIPDLVRMKKLREVSVDEKLWARCDADKLVKLSNSRIKVNGMSADKNGLKQTDWKEQIPPLPAEDGEKS